MLDVNLHTLNFVRSTNEPDKLFLIEESTGDPVYFRLRVPEGTEARIELYHAPTLAPLGVFQNLSSKLKLISLTNPASTIELKNSGYINFEWTFYFDKILKFCWKKDIVGLAGTKRGFTCWMSRKPDPDYPCAIYKPGSSTVPPFCQFLDFNIRRIDSLQDPLGLKYVILLSLLGFTEALADHEVNRNTFESPPRSQSKLPSAITLEAPTEPNEIRVSGHRSTSEYVTQGLKLFEDPLLLYISVHASSSKEFKQAINVAEQIKRDRLKKCGEELHQYLVDDILNQEMAGNLIVPSSSRSTNSTSSSLRVYLSRTPLDELLPKSSSKTNVEKSAKSSLLPPASTQPLKTSTPRQSTKPQIPPKDQRHGLPTSSSSTTTSNSNTIHSRLMTGVHRPFSKIMSIASNSSRSNAYHQDFITPYFFEEEQEISLNAKAGQEEEVEDQIETTKPLRILRDRPADPEKENLTYITYHRPPSDNLFPKRAEPFLICANELNVNQQKTKRNRVLVKNRTHGNVDEVGIRERPDSLALSSHGRRRSSEEGEASNSVILSSSSESIRSKSSSIKSTASSFVEIILSSCCSAYSSAINGLAHANADDTIHRKQQNKNSRRNLLSSPTSPAWKRLSHLGGRQNFVSNLFSSKLDTI